MPEINSDDLVVVVAGLLANAHIRVGQGLGVRVALSGSITGWLFGISLCP